jgi:hypothetical protein
VNPYEPLFSNPVDSAVAWLFTAGWTVVGVFLLRPGFASLQSRAERVCAAAAASLLALSTLIAMVFITGLVFLVWLQLTSGFWLIWQLFYLMSVVCIFRVLPVVACVLLAWAALGRWRSHFGTRSFGLSAGVMLAVIGDALLYFALETSVS